MAQQQVQPILRDIKHGDLEAVQQRVLADGAVLEERTRTLRLTPLMQAIFHKKPVIALWLVGHRGQHDLEATDSTSCTALHWASAAGPLEVVQALVAAGADPAPPATFGITPLMEASNQGHTDIVAFLLQLPAVRATIDIIDQEQETALSHASFHGYQPIVQLLLDAGADPTIPAGPTSLPNQALSNNYHAVAALLRHTIAEAERARALHKARSLLSGGAAALACLQGRMEQGQALPLLELKTSQLQQLQQLQHLLQERHLQQHLLHLQQHQHELQQLLQRWQCEDEEAHEKLQTTVAFAVGVSGGENGSGLCEDLYKKLLGYMLPAWADKGPAVVEEQK